MSIAASSPAHTVLWFVFTRAVLACSGNSHQRVSVCLSMCLSVCLSVTRRYCIKTAKRRITQITPCDSPGTTFLTPKLVGGWPPSPWNLRSKWPTPFQTAQFRPIFAYSASTVRAKEKSSVSTNRKSTARFPTSHRWTDHALSIEHRLTVYVTPKSPKGGTKRDFCYIFQ